MPVARVPKKIKAWSFSRYGDYDDCPRKAKYKHVQRIVEPIPSPEDEPDHPLNRGSRIHKEAEDFLLFAQANGPGGELPESLSTFAEEFDVLARDAGNCHVEEQWTFKKDWSRTSWFARNAWLRVKLDCAHLIEDGVLRVIDFKTGKCRPEQVDKYRRQTSLYALAAFIMFPDVKEVRAELWFVDPGVLVAEGSLTNPHDPNSEKYTGFNFTREPDAEGLKEKWLRMSHAMLIDETFAPNPTFKCRWCYFSKKKGGICEAG